MFWYLCSSLQRRLLLHATLALVALTYFPASAEPAAPSNTPHDVAQLWTGGMTPNRVAYEYAVIELALKKSRDQFGPYELHIDKSDYSTERAIRELRAGDRINIASAPVWPINMDADAPMTIVPVAIARGLMGYRRLVVNKENLERFTLMQTREAFAGQVAGLGRGWSDVTIFEQGGLPVLIGDSISQLYSMLARHRFDYFPLGAMEAQESVASSGHSEELTIVPNLILYYPLPVYLQVSRHQPRLAERLEHGLTLAREDGSLNQLFDHHYSDLVEELKGMDAHLVVLDNPLLPAFETNSAPELLPRAELLPERAD